jgi:alpha-mannosidase
MLKHPDLTERRVILALDRIRASIYDGAPFPLEVMAQPLAGEPIPAGEAMAGHFVPFHIGERWGLPWGPTWFRLGGTVPESWKGRLVIARLRLGWGGTEGFTCEALVYRDGKPLTGLNVNHDEILIAEKAKGGESFTLDVEAAANPHIPVTGAGEIPACRSDEPIFVLETAEIACVEPDVWDFYHDFAVAADAMVALPENEPRRGRLRAALNNAINNFDESIPGTAKSARAALREIMDCRNGDTVHRISAIGHAHIDSAWLWPLRETIRKCARTFATALQLMEEYPEFVFGCSQAQHYAWMKKYYPSIYEGIKKAVKQGRWEPLGSMWVEADCNLSSGEALVRQLLHGKRFFEREFGVETVDVWLPDVFGFSAGLPQIMKQAGVEYFLAQKLSWNQFNQFPHNTFLWEGIDGTKIFSHFPPSATYNGNVQPGQILNSVREFREHDRAARSLYVYGFGDGGGGPTKSMLENAKRLKDFEGLPEVTLEKVSKFFPKAERDAKDLPVWVGELYLESHRGTYTTQARNKRENRKSELLLRDAEFLDVAAAAENGGRVSVPDIASRRAVYDVTGEGSGPSVSGHLERAWKLLLLNQFHDIIPGSSISWVYEDSAHDYETIRQLGSAVIGSAKACLADAVNTSQCEDPFLVVNSCGFERNEVVELPGGRMAIANVPACGYAIVDADRPRALQAFAPAVTIDELEHGFKLDNGVIRVLLDADGLISSVWDHEQDREVIAAGKRGNLFQLHRDYPNAWDAWDVDIFYRETFEDITELEEMVVEEENALSVTLRIVRSFGNSRIKQRVKLRAGSRRIDFHTLVDWHEAHRFLKVAFPVEIHANRATYDIQFGYVERPTHMNTRWDMARFEVCAQKWADLSENDYGVALLNDCKYGYDIFGNVMRLSLLRAPKAPDPTADLGHHEFTYSLMPHRFGPRTGNVIPEAYSLNIPLRVYPVAPHPGKLPRSRSYFSVDRASVVIESIKHSESGEAVIVRFFESHGTRGPITLKTSMPFTRVSRVDLLERHLEKVEIIEGRVRLAVRPFEIVTLKFE